MDGQQGEIQAIPLEVLHENARDHFERTLYLNAPEDYMARTQAEAERLSREEEE